MAHTNTRKEKQMQIFNQAEEAKSLLETLHLLTFQTPILSA